MRALPLILLLSACNGAFRFTEDSGLVDGGSDDAGADAGTRCLISGECECLGDAQCQGVRAHCAADQKCVECETEADCGPNALCDGKTRRCITPCTDSAQCTVDTRTTCGDDLPRHCMACDDLGSCGPTLKCVDSVGYCAECVSSADCVGPKTRCDRRTGTCVTCLLSADCAANEFCVLATGTCQPRQ